MSLILDRCPFYEEATEADTLAGPILIRSYQIMVWVFPILIIAGRKVVSIHVAAKSKRLGGVGHHRRVLGHSPCQSVNSSNLLSRG